MADDPLRVEKLDPQEKLPWRARGVLRRARRRSRTGVVLHAAIRQSPTSMTYQSSVVSVYEGSKRLCMCSRNGRRPKFAKLPPGRHMLTFQVARLWGSTFTREVVLGPGDILVALCEPIQPNVFYKRSPTEDRWRIAVFKPHVPDRG